MLSVFIAHIIISVCCAWCGYLFYNIISDKEETRPIVYYLLGGFISLSLISQVIVLFFPISVSVQLSLAFVILLTLLLRWKDAKWLMKIFQTGIASLSLLSTLLLFIGWLLIILISAGPLMMDDTESYHIQSIKWIQEFGTVPGLVNLHERFGFNTSWFSSVALFSFSNNTTGGYTVLNSLLSIWFCYWFITKMHQLLKENNRHSALTLLLTFACCIAVWPMIRGNAATTNYDFITTVFVFILFSESFLLKEKEFNPGIEWLIWPIYLFTVRIINFPLLILCVFALLFLIRRRKIQNPILPLGYCLLLIAPFITRNVFISGYPFFPSMYFDWFTVDWKADIQQTEKLLEYIKYYNRVPTTFLEIEQTKALGSGWTPSWFRYLFNYDKIIVIAGALGLIIGLSKIFTRRAFLFFVVFIIWISCWFFISPDPRFVYGGFLAGFFILVNAIFNFIKNEKLFSSAITGITIIIVVTLTFFLISKPLKQPEYRNWVMPAKLPQPPVKEVSFDGINFYTPEIINNNWNARCYGTKLPCLYKIDDNLKPRGKKISDGFRLEK